MAQLLYVYVVTSDTSVRGPSAVSARPKLLYVYVQVRATFGVTDVSVTVRVSRLPEVSYVNDAVRFGSVIDAGKRNVACQVVVIVRALAVP